MNADQVLCKQLKKVVADYYALNNGKTTEQKAAYVANIERLIASIERTGKGL